jgi:hypothetical protein
VNFAKPSRLLGFVALLTLLVCGSTFGEEKPLRVEAPDHLLVAEQLFQPTGLAIYRIDQRKEDRIGIFDLGENEIVRMKWSPNSKFLVFTTSNSRGHSPWHFPAYIYSVSDHSLRSIDKETNLGSVVDPSFTFKQSNSVVFKVVDPSIGYANEQPKEAEWKLGDWVKPHKI